MSTRKLDENGRCCGIKPLVYRRDPHFFCFRCNRAYDLDSGEQIENWAFGLFDGEWKQKDALTGGPKS